MSRTDRPSGEAGEPLDIGHRVAAQRSEALRRSAVRRRRRQILPAVVAGSATLAGVGLAGSWVNGRLPQRATVAVLSPGGQPTAPADQARLDALESRLADEEQALQSLLSVAAGAANTGPGGPKASAGLVGPSALSAQVVRPLAAAPAGPALAARAPAQAPATHATTGASHVR